MHVFKVSINIFKDKLKIEDLDTISLMISPEVPYLKTNIP